MSDVTDHATGFELVRPDSTVRISTIAGERPALVVVPGVMADAASWLPVAAAAAAGHEVHVMNRRGRTPSGPLGDGYSLDTEIADVRALLDTVPGAKHLFGWSYGGLAALEAAIGRDDLASVIAYEPVSRPFAPGTLDPIRDAIAAGDTGRAVELVNVEVSGFPRSRVEDLRSGPDWQRLCELARPLAEELAAIDRFDPHYDAFAGIAAPTTLIVGEHNLGDVEPYGPPFERFRAALPHAPVTVLPGIGHLAHVDAPELLGGQIATAVRTATG